MKALIQRVTSSSVEVDGTNVGQISKGLLVFIGIEKLDELSHADKMINKILSYRVFSDENDKMNLSVSDIGVSSPGLVGGNGKNQLNLSNNAWWCE